MPARAPFGTNPARKHAALISAQGDPFGPDWARNGTDKPVTSKTVVSSIASERIRNSLDGDEHFRTLAESALRLHWESHEHHFRDGGELESITSVRVIFDNTPQCSCTASRARGVRLSAVFA